MSAAGVLMGGVGQVGGGQQGGGGGGGEVQRWEGFWLHGAVTT